MRFMPHRLNSSRPPPPPPTTTHPHPQPHHPTPNPQTPNPPNPQPQPPPRTKWPPFRRRHFQKHFREWTVALFDSNFNEIVPYGQIDNKSSLIQVMAWLRPNLTQFPDIYAALWVVARARPAVPLGLWSITSSLRGNLYVPRLHKFIKWFADNDVAHRN